MPALRVAIIERHDHLRTMLGEALWAAGMKVAVAADSADLLEALAEGRTFDAVITGFLQPKMDGIALLRAVKQVAPDCRGYLFSGYLPDADVLARFGDVVDGTFWKPPDIRAIVNELRHPAKTSTATRLLGGERRRGSRRLPPGAYVELRLPDAVLEAQLVDVSVNGLGLELHRPFPVGLAGELRAYIHGLRALEGDVGVRWCRPTGSDDGSFRVGFEFLTEFPGVPEVVEQLGARTE
jgi:CheY-like chemotaxis protein